MSERKVLNKYFPPNFDPSHIPRRKKPKDQQHKVRLMSPFSMRCESCGEYIYKGKKFNARKETVEGEAYLGIKIYRFYIRCPRCSAEITFKTDPKNTDYVAENGANRNFEPWREEDEHKSGSEEDPDDPMKSLEDRTLDSKREMDIMDALDEIRTRNAKSERINVEEILDRFSAEDKQEINERMKLEDEQDEQQAKAVFESADGEQVRRLREAEPDPITLLNKTRSTVELPSFKSANIIKKRKQTAESPVVVVKKKKQDEEEKSKAMPNGKSGALLLLANYDDSDSDSD
ncbi:MAG: CWC16 protein [Benjaminiella poitrasii]|nr:MAG: CWC16 protein [Benjaminiella poitrasii]